MINRVDGNQYREYSQRKITNSIQDNGEKFSLNYKQDNLQTEQQEKKKENGKETGNEIGKEKTKTIKQGGVTLELSSDGQHAGFLETKKEEIQPALEETKTKSFLTTVQEFLADFIQTVKNFFYRIWYDEAPSTEIENTEANNADIENADAEGIVGGMEEADAETIHADSDEAISVEAASESYAETRQMEDDIDKYLRTGNLPQVINLLTDNGRKTIAKNSTLVTYYDRNGKVFEPSASDKERILHGDRGSRTL